MDYKMGSCSGPKLITSDLLFLVDAGNSKSYAGSGTTNVTCLISGIGGTRVNGTGFSSANSGSFFFGAGAGSTIEYITFLNNTPINPSGPCTICLWFKTDTLTGSYTYLLKYTAAGSLNGYYITASTSVVHTLQIVVSNAGTLLNRGQFSVTNTGWVYACFVPTPLTPNAYRNGVDATQAANGTTLAGFASTAPMYIGNTTATSKKINISQVQIYNRVLTSAEILQNYNAQKSRYGL